MSPRQYRLHAIIADVVIYFTSSLRNLYRVNTRRYAEGRMEKRGEGGGGGTRVSCIFRDSNEIRDKWNARNSREAIK